MASEEVLNVLREFAGATSQQLAKKDLASAINNLRRDVILKAVPDVVHSHGASNLLRLLLEGLSNSDQNRNSLMLRVMQAVLTEVCDSEAVPEASAQDIIHVMSLRIHELSSNDLAMLIQACLKFIQLGKNIQGKWLSLFPMVFSELGKQSRVTIDGETMPGPEYCSEIINSLCNTNVATEDAVAFTAMLRELKMPTNSINRFVEKLCAIIPEMEPQEVPPLIYQLLFLCDQSSDPMAPLQHLASYFQKLLKRSANTTASTIGMSQRSQRSRMDSMEIEADIIEIGVNLRDVLQSKATSIYHISRAAATGHPLGKEFVKFINSRSKVPELVLIPFTLEVALSLGGLPQLREVIDLLRKAIMNSLASNEKQQHSAWMREIVRGENIKVLELLESVMQQCTCEWDNIFKGFELLAFSLLETKAPGLMGRPAATNAAATIVTSTGPNGGAVYQQCWFIGSQVLLKMIKKFPDTAQIIVQKLVERLQDVGNDTQYINTISLLVQNNPLSMIECKASITNLLYSMDYRGVQSAKRLYSGISPLFRSCGSLRDSAFLVLRKLLHSCSEDSRQVAVVCFLQILKNFRFYVTTPNASFPSLSQVSMSSQATVDIHQYPTASANRAFCNELIKLLQCTLSQQAIVRSTLYKHLPEVVSRNPELLPECVKMLRNHLKFFLNPDVGVEVPMCVAKDGHASHIIEPLGHLIQAILQVIMRGGNDHLSKDDIDGNSDDQVDLAILMLRKILKLVSEASTDDFPLGDDQASLESCLKIETISSVCVALADFTLACNATTDKRSAQLLVRLHEMYAHFEGLLKDKGGGAKGKGGGKGKGGRGKKADQTNDGTVAQQDDIVKEGAAKLPKRPPFEMCSLSLQNIALFISFVDDNREDATRNAEVLALFKSAQHNNLRLWIFQAALAKYQALRTNGDVEGLSPESLAKYSGTIGRALLVHVQQARGLGEELPAAIFLCALNCLHEMIQSIAKHYPLKLVRLLMTMDGVDKATMPLSLEVQLPKSMKHFKQLLNRLLSGRESEEMVSKSVPTIIGILTTLSDSFTNPASDNYGELLEWTLTQCKDVQCSESSTVKALMSFLVHLTTTRESNPVIFLQIAKEIRLAVGTLGANNDSTAQPPNKFATINEDTASGVLSVLASSLDQLLQIAEWTLCRVTVVERGDASPVTERSIFSRLNLVVNSVSELLQTDIRPGPNSELVLKMATLLYTTMSRVTKSQGKVITPYFEKLVKLIATNLTPQAYIFIGHVDKQSNEEKGTKRKRGDQSAPNMRKSARSIPALVFALEQYSQTVLAVSKRTKTDLSFGFKLGTTRDFKIKNDKVSAALDDDGEQSQSDQENDQVEANRNDETRRTESPNAAERGTGVARRSRGRGRGKLATGGKARAAKN